MKTYGDHLRTPFTSTTPYPRSAPLICRAATPGRRPADRRAPTSPSCASSTSIRSMSSSASCRCSTCSSSRSRTWSSAPPSSAPSTSGKLECWCKPEPRLKASILVGQDNTEAAVAEIERCAATGKYVQVNVSPRANEPLGRRRYWPIYEAAQAAGLPLGIHVGGYGGHAPTGGGWPSYYNEEHHSNAHSVAAQLTSLVIEGVPERFPKLKFVFIEGGFGWVPAITWRMDKHWQRFRDEVPHVKRPPSEYVREHFWFTTQPIEEPDNARHLRAVIEWIGIDRLLFSSDYPHWDYDDARFAFKTPLTDAERAKIFNANARAVYKFG